jgi:hypothetical protein
MTIVLPSNFQDWFQEWRHNGAPTHALQKIEGSCMLPKRVVIDMLRDAYQAGVSVAMEAAAKTSSN